MKDQSLWFFFPSFEISGADEKWVISMTERVIVTWGFGRAKTRFGKIKCTQEHGKMVPLRYQELDLPGLRRMRQRIRRHIEARSPELNRQIEHAITDGTYEDIPVDANLEKKEKEAA